MTDTLASTVFPVGAGHHAVCALYGVAHRRIFA